MNMKSKPKTSAPKSGPTTAKGSHSGKCMKGASRSSSRRRRD